jgi:RNA polymerase-associated protein RTF1
MYLISDSRPSQDDVNKYMNVMKSARAKVLSKRQAAKLRRKQDELVNNYTYTKEDIERNLQERKKTGKTAANLSLAQTRADLEVRSARSAIADAQSRLEDGNRALLELGGSDARKEADLERNAEMSRKELNQAKLELETRLEEQEKVKDVADKQKKKLTTRRKDMDWAKVNQRNKELNETADFEAFKEQKARAEAEAKSGGQPKFNPYARRKVKPKMLWEVGQKEEKKDDDPKEKGPETPAEDQNGRRNETAIKAAQAAKAAEKAAQSHQFNLDDEAEVSGVGVAPKQPSQARVRKGISLTEYQERKAGGTL